ncbi:bile acid:sodium symporter [Rhizobium sp. AAP116]|jgi:BASS family bile acid:Na+ symporter|uniref:bile acid:sodium symporter family protein n=1 Tax=Rhizobium sp. AAP116 TaxID=1523429 RepID=UPI0006B91926|nr:bile acid:sodium symporter [Rhizobium sp. AAP116]MBU0833257.1 bile acid:sodium symporter [Alphaproteobacteria bacterium]MDM7979652.1 bile acid:sodium symporter [Rhizobium sp.]KPF60626.1 transporter [Rhizobium sp. AAP116]MDM8013922.1 bile acid:sodium symporter [Rhizobium sp.]MDZ7874317.1 bile acid:sodium symporter [Rhizobium sp.]
MLTELETTLLGIMMMVIMLGMGASMTWRDFFIAFRKPKGILVGLFSQYLIMPFLGYALALALGLPAGMAAGLILIACMPGGTTSNIFAYFSKGVLALSIMMTTVSTLVAVVTVPFLLSFYSGLAGLGGDYVIPAGNVAQVLVVLLVPTVLGMFLRKMNANVGATIEMIGSLLGVVVILFLIGSWVPRNYQMLLDTPFPVYIAAVGIGLTGMLLGYWLARALRQDSNRARTISLETGIQNGPLAALIVTLSFTGIQQQEVLFIPILYSLFIVITSSFITMWYRRSATAEALARDAAKVRV